MRLRFILLILALLAFVFAVVGGTLFYSSLKDSALKDAKSQCLTNVEMVRRNLTSFLSRNIKPVKALARLDPLQEALVNPGPQTLEGVNTILDIFNSSLEVGVCYLMNDQGRTVASSNRGTADSFVDQNFSFRPYFQKAIQGDPHAYLALGVISKKRGVYYSHPVYGPEREKPVGVVVIKASIEYVEQHFLAPMRGIVLIQDPEGVIFISSREKWLYQTVQKLKPETRQEIHDSLQFGSGDLVWSGLKVDQGVATDSQNRNYLVYERDINNFPGWKLLYLFSKDAIMAKVQKPLRITGPFVFILCALIGVVVTVLYTSAEKELVRRKKAELDLRKSQETYKTIYHNTPAMLHSIDHDYRLVNVSDYWLEVTGYAREEVIGKKLTNFFVEESRRYAESITLPQFFKNGMSKEVPYRFIKKNGRVMDILLSCYGVKDDQGRIVQTLAVSMDVTQRNRVQEELRRTKERLSEYSRNLEKEVRKRTREISGILTYTPAVIYIKNDRGEYQLINDRFEKLFNISNDEIIGKTDQEMIPPEVARQLRQNDLKVLTSKTESQCTEWVEQEDGVHTYLSVKFPIYGDEGDIYGVCGISTDITELQKAQDKLRRLSGTILASQEKERAVLSRELHDELGQMLTTLRMDAVWMEKRLRGADSKAAQRAAIMSQVIDKTIDNVRNMAFQLRPGLLDDLGLVEALESLAADFEKRTDMVYVFERNGVPELSSDISTAVYRIVQEAMTNAVRHSQASQVGIRLFMDQGRLTVEVVDDGKGFAVNEESLETGFGLTGMKERASLVGGDLWWQSSPGKGTLITCRVPVQYPGPEQQGHRAEHGPVRR